MVVCGQRMVHRLGGARMVAVLALAALSGCLGADGGPGAAPAGPQEPGPEPAPAPPPAGDCDAAVSGLPVPPTLVPHGGAWSSFVQPDLQGPQGYRGVGAADPGLSLLVDHAAGSRAEVQATVHMLLVSGAHPDGAGLAFHWQGGSYNIVRYSPSEGGWHVFTVVDGERAKVNATVAPDAPPVPGWCSWTEMSIVARGADVQVFQDGQEVLAAALPDGAATEGEVGLFVRGGSIALFRGLAIGDV
jgi:hypothetical protein